ncbi:sialoadhesin-like isoform X1 [Brienomyrus brachyistius]|uniref:sialoadhesin-like isoform X1 n=1 Tax=Brienomyrus brachyistius TaxID=42636 RepID=UPI0020B1B0C6|nr:sialoadhesin-like isoform X1 [Brienomyrus brachyistius]
MGAGDSLTFWGLAVLVLPGVMSRDWNVRYPEKPVCAARGSTVVIPCGYDYPEGYKVETIMWCHNNSDCKDAPYVCHSNDINVNSQYRSRAECLGDKENNCTLRIKNITDADAGVYRFRFITNEERGKWTGPDGVTLKVDGGAWSVNYTERTLCAVRGSTVVIHCRFNHPESYRVESRMWSHNAEDCAGKSYVWHNNSHKINISTEYRDRAEVLENTENNCTLMIKNITDADAGLYRFSFTAGRCELCAQPGVELRVGELKVMVTSSTGKGLLIEGDSVNLTCGSENCSLSQSEFTWFKDNKSITDTLSTIHFNPVSYNHSGNYSCALKGYIGTVSSTLILNIQSCIYPAFPHYNPMTVILVCLGILLPVLAVTVCIMRRKRNSLNEPNDRGGEKQIAEDNEYADIRESGSQTGSQRQEAPSQGEGEEVCYASVQFNTKPPGRQCDVSNAESPDDAILYAAVRKPAICS